MEQQIEAEYKLCKECVHANRGNFCLGVIWSQIRFGVCVCVLGKAWRSVCSYVVGGKFSGSYWLMSQSELIYCHAERWICSHRGESVSFESSGWQCFFLPPPSRSTCVRNIIWKTSQTCQLPLDAIVFRSRPWKTSSVYEMRRVRLRTCRQVCARHAEMKIHTCSRAWAIAIRPTCTARLCTITANCSSSYFFLYIYW